MNPTRVDAIDNEALAVLEYRYRPAEPQEIFRCAACGEEINIPGKCWQMADSYLCMSCGDSLVS